MPLKSDKLTEQMKPLLLASEEKSGIMISFQPQHMVETKVSSEIGKVKQLCTKIASHHRSPGISLHLELQNFVQKCIMPYLRYDFIDTK